MDADAGRLGSRLDEGLWPAVDTYVATQDTAGVAVAVVGDGEVATRTWGVRDLRTGEPVTAETMFHLASVSKPFVATAVMTLATATDGPSLDLDSPITDWVPELTLADGRADEVTARGLLSHTSGLPDVAEYGWHEPQLGDDALSDFARSLSGRRLAGDPGTTFSYSNAGYELLGLLVSRVTGTTFEDAVRRLVLTPLGMSASTFLRAEVPADLAASPHVGLPLTVPGDAYPYTRRHAPSSTLHSNLVELSRWVVAHGEPAADGSDQGWFEGWTRLDRARLGEMWEPVLPVDEPPWEESSSLGWALGSYLGRRVLSHSGGDPGFGARVVIVPERRAGVVVLANTNTVAASAIAQAALDVVLTGRPGGGTARLGSALRPVAGPVAETLATAGQEAAAAEYHRLSALDPAEHDLDDEGFEDAVWGAIELHRTDLAWPMLRLWTDLRPGSSTAWMMTGWAHDVDGDPDLARTLLLRALDLDPDNEDAALVLSNLDPH